MRPTVRFPTLVWVEESTDERYKRVLLDLQRQSSWLAMAIEKAIIIHSENFSVEAYIHQLFQMKSIRYIILVTPQSVPIRQLSFVFSTECSEGGWSSS